MRVKSNQRDWGDRGDKGSRGDKGPQSLKSILSEFDWDKKKYISREFQDYGYRLAEDLSDLEHKALYIKLAKESPRPLLEKAKNFVKDAPNVRSKARLFMWKLRELKKDRKRLNKDHPSSKD